MKSLPNEDFISNVGELNLCNFALIDLMQAIFRKKKLFKFKAKGVSMFPFIRNGDILTIAPLPAKLPRVGDVIAFVHPRTGKLTIHRVIKRAGASFFPQGDNAIVVDGNISQTDILGVVIKVERKGRKIGLGLKKGQGVVVAFLVRKHWLMFLMYFYRKVATVFRRISA